MASTISDRKGEIRPTLVVGAAGQLGRMVTAYWPEDMPILCSGRDAAPEFIKLDLILDPKGAQDSMAGVGAVICLAGVTPAGAAHGGDVFSRNTDVALAAIRAAHGAGAGRVFLTSSAAVYGAAGGIMNEASAPAPVSEYGRAKEAMEQAAVQLARELDHPVTILRIGNVAGADAILGGWRVGMALDQLPDGSTPARSYIGPKTLSHVVFELTQATDLPQILNVTAPDAVQMGALLDAADLPWDPRPAHDTVIANVTLCTKLLEKHVHLAPESGTPTELVAQWRAYQTRDRQPPN